MFRPILVALTLSVLLPPRSCAAAEAAKIIPLAEVKPGMTGYGLTVFEGTRPDRFAVRVVGVLHNFLPKEDVILIRSDDARLLHTGVAAGMSGSPIYLTTPGGDRLAGALAYGWAFAKDPIAGVTPIENMLAELGRPLRGRQATPSMEASRPPPAAPPIGDRGPGEPSLRPVSVPLSVAGFSAAAVEELKRGLEPYHLVPLAAGGAARPQAGGPKRLEAGGAMSVQLVRGDMSIAATGTVTYVDGNRVLAFGHPMLNVGEVYLPVATAEVHTFMAALSSSFKVASPLSEVGSLVQDRQAGVVALTGERSDMIPLRVDVRVGGKAVRAFRAEVVRHRFLTPMLATLVVLSAAQEAASDVADATITLRTRLGLRGEGPLELTDHAFSPEGVSGKVFALASGLRAVSELLFNPFSPVNLDRLEVEVDVDYRPDVADITRLALRSDEIDPGSRPSLTVSLRPYNGREYTTSVPIDVPRFLAGRELKIEAAAGNLVKPDLAPPESLGGLIANLRQSYPARSIVVTVETPEDDLTLRGAVLEDLPASVADTLRPGASSRRGETFKRNMRFVVPTRGVMQGKQSLQVRVRELPRGNP